MKSEDIERIAKAVNVIESGCCTKWRKVIMLNAVLVVTMAAFFAGVALSAHMSFYCGLQFCVAIAVSLLTLVIMMAVIADCLKMEIEKKCDVITKAIEKCAEMEEKEAENRANKEASEERRVHELLLKFMECQLQKEDLHVHLPE